jgi:ribosomal 50S subunit-recycling heat shock protein
MAFTEPAPTPLALLLLGQGADPESERGVECPGDLPPASDPDLVARAAVAKAALGDRVYILGHHYQRDEVIQFADTTGDSFKLSQQAAAHPEAEFIVFCGVHFMAESADILTADHQQVVLPDLAAGCSMADMAAIHQVDAAWAALEGAGIASTTIPITYMNSSADIKSFTGRNGGAICTSSNAKRSLEWAFERGERVFFLPDQHLGRNTAVRDLGMSLDDCVLWDPHRQHGGLTDDQLRAARVTGEKMLQILETRLDTLVDRLGFSATRRGARQMVSHGHINVNGRRVSIPSFSCRAGDVIEVRDHPKSRQLGTRGLETTQIRPLPDWLTLNKDAFKGSLNRIPTREELTPVANEQLVVELYSRS